MAAMNAPYDENRIVLADEQVRRRRGRSIAIALSLALFVVLVYAVTVVKLGPGVLVRPVWPCAARRTPTPAAATSSWGRPAVSSSRAWSGWPTRRCRFTI